MWMSRSRRYLSIGEKEFMKNEKVCVGGVIDKKYGEAADTTTTVPFGYTFPRIPLVSVAFSQIHGTEGNGKNNNVFAYVGTVQKSSAVIYIRNYDTAISTVSWIACM